MHPLPSFPSMAGAWAKQSPFIAILCFAAAASAAEIAWLGDEVVNRARLAVVMVEVHENQATSGFFASEDGLVVTTAAGLEGLNTVIIYTAEKEKIQGAKLRAILPEHDLAVLATGKKSPAYLKIRSSPAKQGEPCAVIYNKAGAIRVADGILLTRRRALDWTETRFQDLWSLILAPEKVGLTGAPIITADGTVGGLCDFVHGGGMEKFNFALPEAALQAALDRARATKETLPFPKVGAINRRGYPVGDLDYMEGMRLMSLNDGPGAREKFRASLSHHPESPLIMLQLASACMRAGGADEAEKWLRECMRLEPDTLMPRYQLGILIKGRGDKEETLRYWQELVAISPEFPQAWSGLSEILFNSGRKAEALAATKKWTELQPELFRAWDAYATQLSIAGDFAEASRARAKSAELESLLFKARYSVPQRE